MDVHDGENLQLVAAIHQRGRSHQSLLRPVGAGTFDPPSRFLSGGFAPEWNGPNWDAGGGMRDRIHRSQTMIRGSTFQLARHLDELETCRHSVSLTCTKTASQSPACC